MTLENLKLASDAKKEWEACASKPKGEVKIMVGSQVRYFVSNHTLPCLRSINNNFGIGTVMSSQVIDVIWADGTRGNVDLKATPMVYY